MRTHLELALNWGYGAALHEGITIDLSIVIPVYNEEESLPLLLDEIRAAILPTGLKYEVVLVDDGSRDKSSGLEKLIAGRRINVALSFRRNFGQTAAMQAGIDYAKMAKSWP